MATQPNATEIPPVHVVLSEVVASLTLVAHAYLSPPPGDASEAAPDLESAEIALDVAGRAFDRIRSKLPADEQSAMARLLTDSRLTYVKKRGA